MKSRTLLGASACLACAVASSEAASIAYVGSVEGGEVTDWRTTTSAKSLDIDGDNFYGTHAAVHWTVVGVNQQSAGSTTPGWAFLGSTPQYSFPDYVDVDHPTSYPADVDAGITAAGTATFDFELTGDAGTYAGQTVRIGIMHDLLTPGEQPLDTFKGLQVVQTVGGAGDSGMISLRGGAAGDGSPEMYFFDLTAVNAGDRFQIVGGLNIGGTSGATGAYIGPVSWDLVPEPSFMLLAGLGALALFGRRRV